MEFSSKEDLDTWLDAHTHGGNFGFLGELYMLMEHIYHDITVIYNGDKTCWDYFRQQHKDAKMIETHLKPAILVFLV